MLVNLMTTGQNRIRFNPNLYNDGKVRLSIFHSFSIIVKFMYISCLLLYVHIRANRVCNWHTGLLVQYNRPVCLFMELPTL